jgi:hypothetical protein
VRVTVVAVVTVDVVTAKVAELAPPATVTLAGTVAAGLLSDSVTTAPAVGAGPERVTVPVVPEPPVTLAGLTLTDARVGGGWMDRVALAPPPA